MKLIAQLKLLPTLEQSDALKWTLEAANSAANYISEAAWETETFGKFALQRRCYAEVRERFGLSAQVTVRALAKVGDAYKLDKRTKRIFKPLGSIAYDDRILSWNLHEFSVSIWSVEGRLRMWFVTGERQMELLKTRMGETDIVYRRGEWYLLATCEVNNPDPLVPQGVLGVDMGIRNIASDSDGNIHSGTAVNSVRHRNRKLKRKLQKKRTKSKRRRLQKLSGKERRFATNTNHIISKCIVELAERTKRAIALEDLKGIRFRVRARRSQRAHLHSWSFGQLRAFIEYKAHLVGVPVLYVDPRNTSLDCPQCGHISKTNRPSRATFGCTACGTAGHADVIAAGNIASRAVVMLPNVSEAVAVAAAAPGTSPRL
ncbi:MAG: transposase [Actinomycetota bacterium]|nr:transposase [Actinomycetota bacterium]